MLKCRENFEKFLAACNSSKNTGLPQFFSKVFWQLYFKNISLLTKTKKCLLCWFLWIQNYQMTGTYLTSNTTFSKKVNPIKYPIRQIYWWGPGIYYSYSFLVCIKSILNVKKLLTWLKLYLDIISALKLNINKQKKPFVIQY